jgi:hypothetical protein
MRWSLGLISFLLSSVTLAQEWARISPFTEVEVIGDSVEVTYEGQRYDLLTIEGLATKDILDWCRKNHPDRWEDRFAMDLVEVLGGMNVKVGDHVKLELRKKDGQVMRVERALLTRANRDAVSRAQTQRPWKQITPAEMRQILDEYEKVLDDRWSYLAPSNFDHRKAIRDIRARINGGLLIWDFLPELQKVIGRGIDGHATIVGWERFVPQGYLPFLIDSAGDRFIAFTEDRRKFLSNDHPCIESIDGRPIKDWLDAAAVYIPDGSPQLVRQRALAQLRSIQFMRKQLDLPRGPKIEVVLASIDGKNRKTIQLDVSDAPPTYGTWPRERSKPNLPAGIEYLRLADMPSDPRAGQTIDAAFAAGRRANVAGLIIDVRDNGGGARDSLRHVAAHLMKPNDPSRVVNVAAYRIHPDHARMMESRFLYPENSDRWTAAERESIATFKKTFHPKWQIPPGKYSDLHYLILSPAKGNLPRFDKPVVILMNSKCFSATDIFLSSLKGMPNVTLIGTPSAGGSANVNTVTLHHPLIRARLGTMISFQPDGTFLDGNGVKPDIHIDPTPAFFIGGEDNQLAAAISLITKQADPKPAQ